VSPDGFFGIQILPNSVTAGGTYDTPSALLSTPLSSRNNEYYKNWCLSLSKIWLESLLLRLLCCTMRHRTVIWKHDVIYKTGNTLRIATPPEENRRTRAICSMHKKLGKFGRVVSSYSSRQKNGQLNRHTHQNTSHPCGSMAHLVYS